MSNLLISNEQIQERLKEIADEINNHYDEITLLVTLTGGLLTAVDLSKYINIPVKFEFAKISSYGCSKTSSGIVEMKWFSKDKGSHLGNVLIVDDIYDTGRTMDYLIRYIENNFTYSCIDTMVLLEKPARHELSLNINYVGFTIDDKFVYGYGLDLNEYERNKLDILEFKGDKNV